MVAEFLQPLAQDRVLVEVGKWNAFGIELARHVRQRDALRLIGAADDAAGLLAGRHGLELLEETAAHHGDTDVARTQMLLGAVGDAALAGPGNDVLVDDVTGDEAAGFVLQRADPGRHALLHVRLAAFRHPHEEPGDAQRILVVDRYAPLEMAAEIKAVRPQRDAPDGPVAILLALPFAHALVDEAVLEGLELELEMF